MGKYKICVYAISKNEGKFVDRWMDSMSEADLVVVTDTGSTDGTVEMLEKRGAVVHRETIDPWRFDAARNVSLSHVPEDVDLCVCTDLDEVFSKGWRQILEDQLDTATSDRGKQVRYTYNWSHNPDGSPGVQFTYSKIHTPKDFKWSFPIHEWLTYIGEGASPETFSAPEIILDHYPDPTKSRSSYLPLLEMAVEEDPEDDRMMHYLGREYMFHGMLDKCIETLKRHLELPRAVWNEERGASMRWIADSYYKKRDYVQGKIWYYRAMAETGHMREPYVEFAKHLYLQGEWPMVHFLITEALKIQTRSSTYTNQEYTWNETPYDLGSLAAFYIGRYDVALEYAKKAVELNPNDSRLQGNLKLIESKV